MIRILTDTRRDFDRTIENEERTITSRTKWGFNLNMSNAIPFGNRLEINTIGIVIISAN